MNLEAESALCALLKQFVPISVERRPLYFQWTSGIHDIQLARQSREAVAAGRGMANGCHLQRIVLLHSNLFYNTFAWMRPMATVPNCLSELLYSVQRVLPQCPAKRRLEWLLPLSTLLVNVTFDDWLRQLVQMSAMHYAILHEVHLSGPSGLDVHSLVAKTGLPLPLIQCAVKQLLNMQPWAPLRAAAITTSETMMLNCCIKPRTTGVLHIPTLRRRETSSQQPSQPADAVMQPAPPRQGGHTSSSAAVESALVRLLKRLGTVPHDEVKVLSLLKSSEMCPPAPKGLHPHHITSAVRCLATRDMVTVDLTKGLNTT